MWLGFVLGWYVLFVVVVVFVDGCVVCIVGNCCVVVVDVNWRD